MKKIYCDISATAPLAPEVSEFMTEIQNSVFGNPSSIHRFGQESRAVIENARRQVAGALHCSAGEIIFTGCGSESNNLVLQSILKPRLHVITSAYEHPSISKTLDHLENTGVEVTRITPERDGTISPEAVEKAIMDNTRLISIMFVNNETGTINPIDEIGRVARKHNILFHTDGVQALGKIPLDISRLPIDYLSMSAHKLFGPKGVGALYIRKGAGLSPVLFGGGQEKNLRPGTENVAGIAGFGLAAELALSTLDKTTESLRSVTRAFFSVLDKRQIPYIVNGSHQVPGVLNVGFPSVDAQALVIRMDMEGIAISSGSACSSGAAKPSSTLMAMGVDESLTRSSVRISFGKFHTPEDACTVAETLCRIITRLKQKD